MSELSYVGLLFGLFVLPQVIARLRVPTAVTSFGLGAACGMGFGLFREDVTVHLLATLGISALFLFAGLDVDAQDLRRGARVIVLHLVTRLFVYAGVAWAVMRVFDLPPRPAALVALGLLTPSTGFILDSLESLGLSEPEKFWVKSKAIAAELLALITLFVVLQSTTVQQFAVSGLLLTALVAVLPLVFRVFARRILPFAPRSEFAFLLMLAVLCAYATRKLGVYYLVGAFLVGVAAQRFREQLPALTSERMLHAVELFASFFIPFYFFAAGVDLKRENFGAQAFLVGVGLLLVMVPLRALPLMLQRRVMLKEPANISFRIGVSLMPTLVFGLVIVQILKERFLVSGPVIGGLVVYTLCTTLIPGVVLKAPARYDQPHLLPGIDRPKVESEALASSPPTPEADP